MAKNFEVVWDEKQIALWRSRGMERAAVAAAKKAGRDAIRTLRVESNRYVRGRKRLKVSWVNNSMKIGKAPGGSDLGALEWKMRVSGDPVPVSAYPWTQVKRGISVAINKGAKRALIKGAFAATMAFGKNIFERIQKGHGSGRGPVKALYTTRVTELFEDRGMVPGVFDKSMITFRATFDRVFPSELEKIGFKG